MYFPPALHRQLVDKLRATLDAETERAMLGGWPKGYQPGEGFPGTLTADKIKPPRCDKIISDGQTS